MDCPCPRRRRGAAKRQGTPLGVATAFATVSGALTQLLIASDSADAAPTTQEQEEAAQALAQLEKLVTEWQSMQPGSRKK